MDRAPEDSPDPDQFDEFLVFLAHELRNQLAPASSGVQVMELLGAEVPDEMVRARDLIAQQIHKLLSLASDLLDLARCRRGKMSLQLDMVDVAGVLGDIVETRRPLFTERSLSISGANAPLFAKTDLERLRQVLGAMLDVALEAGEEGAPIDVTAGRVGDQVQIEVWQRGIALAPDEVQRLFDFLRPGDFLRAHGLLALKLCLARNLVELHGGALQAASSGPKQELIFTLRLPAASPDTVNIPPDQAAVSPGLCRVLIVDDNTEAADMLAKLIRALGHEVHTAYCGVAALAAFKDFSPEVVLLDLQLPDLDGIEVARRLRASPGGERILLAALTGYDRDEDRERCHAAGFDKHLIKPVRLHEIRRLLAEVRDQRSEVKNQRSEIGEQ